MVALTHQLCHASLSYPSLITHVLMLSCSHVCQANELASRDAKEKGGDIAVWLKDGYVQESHWSALAFVTEEDEFVTARPDCALSGRTVLRAMELERGLAEQGIINTISMRPVKA